jgi:hypothetical protein
LVGAAALSLLTYKKPVIATVSPVVSVGVLLLNLSILTSYLFNAQRYDWPFYFSQHHKFSAPSLCAALCLAGVPILESIQQNTENLFL